ncbi:MAG: hypothetical protein J7L40_04480, partial [Candidatus Marinimicrobia bacterium]|nr:hypothetical protein [Candidatus Neomarinimicrobiota bacterium]
MGYKECGDGVTLATGNNTFDFDEFIYLLYNGSGCSIHAHNNYWGTSSPTSALFYNVYIDYWNPYLTSMPSYSPSITPENSVYDERFKLAKSLSGGTSGEEGAEDLTVYYDESWD